MPFFEKLFIRFLHEVVASNLLFPYCCFQKILFWFDIRLINAKNGSMMCFETLRRKKSKIGMPFPLKLAHHLTFLRKNACKVVLFIAGLLTDR